MRRKVQELTSAPSKQHARLAEEPAEPGPVAEGQCLLNLSFDLSVEKLVSIALEDDGAKRGKQRPSMEHAGGGQKSRPDLVSNVRITAEK